MKITKSIEGIKGQYHVSESEVVFFTGSYRACLAYVGGISVGLNHKMSSIFASDKL